ncbi:MAG: nucleotidyltransferase family protein [Patescibacteria group bacterium]
MQKEPELKTVMEVNDVIEIVQLLEAENIDVWLDGGWGVDALLKEQTRQHKDVDVVVSINDVQKMQRILQRQGFRLVSGGAPTNFVLRDKNGRKVDVHPVRFDEKGNGIYRMENGKDWIYPAEGFTGKGKVGGREVRCLTAKTQMLCHTGYEPSEKDFNEMKALRQRFGVEYPEQYKSRF